MSMMSTQDMENNGTDELGKHFNDFIWEKENKNDPKEGEISLGGGHTFFWPPSTSRALVAVDLCTPDLQHVFWVSICILVPLAPGNATDTMFNARDKFLTRMKEADWQFTVFPHNLSQYGTLANILSPIEEPEDLPTEVGDCFIYFSTGQAQVQWWRCLHNSPDWWQHATWQTNENRATGLKNPALDYWRQLYRQKLLSR